MFHVNLQAAAKLSTEGFLDLGWTFWSTLQMLSPAAEQPRGQQLEHIPGYGRQVQIPVLIASVSHIPAIYSGGGGRVSCFSLSCICVHVHLSPATFDPTSKIWEETPSLWNEKKNHETRKLLPITLYL